MNPEVQKLAEEVKRLASIYVAFYGRSSDAKNLHDAIDRLASLARNDHMSTRKADLLAEGGHKFTGYVMHKEGDRAVIIDGGAVRWLTDSDLWTLMHVEGSTVARNEQPAPQVQEAVLLLDMQSDADECSQLRDRLGELLTGVVNALRGPPPKLTLWSWHDLPERAAAAIASIELMQKVAANLAAAPASPPGWEVVWEKAATKVEGMIDRWSEHNPLLPPPYPRSYLTKVAHELRMEIPAYAATAPAAHQPGGQEP